MISAMSVPAAKVFEAKKAPKQITPIGSFAQQRQAAKARPAALLSAAGGSPAYFSSL
jgi:hypothetical protein